MSSINYKIQSTAKRPQYSVSPHFLSIHFVFIHETNTLRNYESPPPLITQSLRSYSGKEGRSDEERRVDVRDIATDDADTENSRKCVNYCFPRRRTDALAVVLFSLNCMVCCILLLTLPMFPTADIVRSVGTRGVHAVTATQQRPTSGDADKGAAHIRVCTHSLC